jgi:hypothetical protein
MAINSISVKLTKHAKIKIVERNITLTEIKKILMDPIMRETDKFDPLLTHYVGMKNDKFLRVIGKWADKGSFLVVSAFYDRRLKRSKHDKD